MSLRRLTHSKIARRLLYMAIIFVVLMVVARIYNVTTYYFDAWIYENYGDAVYVNGFHITNFPDTFRGYFFMVLFSGIKLLVMKLGHGDWWAWRMLVSAMVAVMTVVFLPELFRDFGERRKTERGYVLSLIGFFLIFLLYWGEFLQHVLSDVPAMFFFLGGYYFLLRWIRNDFGWKSWVDAFLAGIMLYAAYNTRVTLLFGVVIALVGICCHLIHTGQARKLSCLLALLAGMLLIAYPQMLINHRYSGAYTPRVRTEAYNSEQTNLQAQQILWGLEYFHYETYIGDLEEYRTNLVFFEDATGQELLAREGITEENFGYGDVVHLFVKYPLDMIGIYTRHVLGVMTPFFRQVYITNAFVPKGWYIVFMMLLWILAGLLLLLAEPWKKGRGLVLCLLIGAILPGILQTAGAAETRFVLMIHVLLYYYLAEVADYHLLREKMRGRALPIVITCAVVFFLWLSNIGMMLGANELSTMIIHDGANHTPQTQLEER